MKKLLFVLLMVLSLVISLPAQAAETPIASFDFDTDPGADYTSITGGTAVAVPVGGSPVWQSEHNGRNGVLYFDGDDALQLFAADDMSSLLKDYTTLTITLEILDQAPWEQQNHRYLFSALSEAQDKEVAARFIRWGGSKIHHVDHQSGFDANNFTQDQWNTIKIVFGHNQITVYDGNGTQKGSAAIYTPLTDILGSNPALFLGASPIGDPDFVGYINSLTITGSTEPNPNPNPNPDPEPVGPSFALNPFNNLGDRRPSLYNGITLDNGSSVERAIIAIPEDNTIILPSDATRESFTIGDKTYAIKGNADNPRKLIGWYNIADGKYYPVTDGPATVTLDPTKNNVFYGDWIAASYDFWDNKTDRLVTTADTSDFIDINVFDYSDLVNVNSMTVQQNGVGSESWSVYDNRENGWLAFSDYGTYRNNNHGTGSIGFPNNRDGSVHGYNGVNANPGILNPADKIISTMFNQNSKPENKNSYVPGINYLGKGNYLFSYDPATGMYSYDCETNAAVYQKSEGRFYVYNSPFEYHSTDKSNNWIVCHDFFPLNFKSDNEKFKLNKENGVPNYWFGMDFTMDFWLPDNSGSGGNQITNADGNNSPMIFEFEGDDDMWVLIDGKLVLDIGGIHDPVEGTINFSTGEVIVKNENGATTTSVPFSAGDHTMKIYYLERGGDKSNCKIKFNLLPEYEVEDPGIDTVQVSKDWVGTPDSEVPPTITVELYDANKGKDSAAIKTATFGIDEAGKWAHSFSNLPHTDKNGNVIKYAIREVGLPQTSVDGKPYFDVDIATKVTTYSNAWVFTDMAGLAGEDYVVIGNGKGQVLGSDLKAHDVLEMDVANNIITQLASNRDAANLLWTIEPATSYQGGKHFYLKNGEQYLCISSADKGIHLHNKEDVLSVFYLNASGDLQDATTGHRLVAKEGGFAVETNVGGNVTTESANKASLYVMRTRETTAYTFKITNTYVDPTVPMGTLQISKTIGGNATNPRDEFTFSIELTPPEGATLAASYPCILSDGANNGEFTMVVDDGVGVITLTDGQSVSIELPVGTGYTVTETDGKDYELTSTKVQSGSISAGSTKTCSFENVRNRYTLTVSKSVTGNAADTTKAFAFTVTLTDKDGKALTGKFGDYTFADGKCVISLAHSESFTIPDLPEGTKYTVSEDSDGYTQTSPADKEVTGTITTGENKVDFVNELNLYTLTVSKSVTGNAADTTKAFAFTVTLTDANGKALTGTFGKYTFDANGQCVISIAHDESFTIPDLPDGTKYVISEENGDYTITAPALTDGVYAGEIKAANASVEFVNALSRFYTLTVSKSVTGNAADITKEFAFTVTLTDKDGAPMVGEYGDYTFDDKGQAVISIAHGKSFTIPDLPDGTKYTISEENGEYTITAPALTDGVYTGEIKAANASVEFVNALSRFYTLTVSKTVTGNAADTTKEFAFTVTLTDKDGKALTGTFGNYTFDTNGQCVISISHSESFTIPDLPDGTKYTISEENGDYTITAPVLTDGVYAGEIKAANASVEFVNALSRFYTLTVSKTVTGNAADTTKEFAFTVTLTDKDGAPMVGEYGDYTFDDKGQAVISISHGKSFTIPDLPDGTKYAISEENGEYTITAPVLTDGVYAGEIKAANASVEFVNALSRFYTLTVSKSVTGNAADTAKAFAFTVTLTDANGKALTGKFGDYTFADGKCVISLAHSESFTIPDLPEGTKYTVSEDSDGYTQTSPADKEVTGTITTGENKVDFVNELNLYTLTVSKTVTGNAADITKEFAFTVTLTDKDGAPMVGEYGDYTFDDKGQAVISISHGKSFTIPDLPDGTKYTISEENGDYTITAPALTDGVYAGEIKAANASVAFVNALSRFYTLTVSKTVTGNAADKTKDFAFTVTLTDKDGKALTGKFGDYTFDEKGQCVISIAHSESFTIPDLPDGTKYTISEENGEYTITSPALTDGVYAGEIKAANASVEFVNALSRFYTLTVSKTVTGNAADKTKDFAFTVTLTDKDDKALTGKFGNYTFDEKGQCIISIAHSESFTIPDLPDGTKYVISEENGEYTITSPTLTDGVYAGEIKAANASVEFVNALSRFYTLTVSKTVTGNAADITKEFAFTVTLTDKDGAPMVGEYGDYTFDDKGQAVISIAHGKSFTIPDLPDGTKYVISEDSDGYTQTAPAEEVVTGTITTGENKVDFVNVRDVVRLVKVTDPTGLTVAPKVTVTGSDGSVVTAEALTANNAAKYLEIPVKPGVTYTVAESGQEVAGYTFVGSELTAKDAEVAVSGMTFTVGKSGMTTIPMLTLTNSYTLDSVTVTIRKVSTGLAEGIAYPAPKVSIYAANSTAPVWTGTLTPNGSALPVKLLPGTYTVKEVIDEVEGYGFTSVLYVNDAASADKTFTLAANALNTELRLDNFYAAEFSTLTLTKTVKGESGSKTSFSFRITLTDDKGQPITERFPYTGTMDGAAPLNGVITSGSTVALRDGGSITVQLPLGVHYEVEEQEQEGYVLVSSEGEKGVIEKDGAKAAFVNKPQYTATVTKVWEGDTADVRPASVQVQLMLNGKPVGDPVTLNAANGWKHTYTGLDAKGPYTVDEVTLAEGYVSTVEEGEGNTFVITNSYIVLPPTGDAAHPALYLLALLGSAALLMLLHKRKAA